jgi:hypothetical protein
MNWYKESKREEMGDDWSDGAGRPISYLVDPNISEVFSFIIKTIDGLRGTVFENHLYFWDAMALTHFDFKRYFTKGYINGRDDFYVIPAKNLIENPFYGELIKNKVDPKKWSRSYIVVESGGSITVSSEIKTKLGACGFDISGQLPLLIGA